MLEDLPPFLTVVQASVVLQIGRSKCYELTVEWERSGGKSGVGVCVVRESEARSPRGARPVHPASAGSADSRLSTRGSLRCHGRFISR